jgi:hypothetical protein
VHFKASKLQSTSDIFQQKNTGPFQALKLVMIVSLMLDLLLQIAANPQRGQGFEMGTTVVAFPTYPFIHGILMFFCWDWDCACIPSQILK